MEGNEQKPIKLNYEKLKKMFDALLEGSDYELVNINGASGDPIYSLVKKEQIKVKFKEAVGSWDDYYQVSFDFVFNKTFDELDKNMLLEKAGEYLSGLLEIYLNENYGK